MAYSNFIPSVWAESINRELERACVFVEDCNRQYEGLVASKGDSVHILGVGKPTIKSLDRENASGEIDAAEEIEDTSVILNINQIRYFNYMVGTLTRRRLLADSWTRFQLKQARVLQTKWTSLFPQWQLIPRFQSSLQAPP